MLRFLKILASNLAKGPSTDAFPAAPAHTPARYRGRITMEPEKCVGCGVCAHVCPADAIHITQVDGPEGAVGYKYSVWHNTCCQCGSCAHFCPTGAIRNTNDWHISHLQKDKYNMAEHHFVPYLRCTGCGNPIRILPPELATRIYAHHPVDMSETIKLCPTCRQLETVKRRVLENQATENHPENRKGALKDVTPAS
jgi:formate hydrogenlyase subunit 6/NADH:ubiquinone oxidoreductase subunit I